jgi:hypothetical protein
MNSRDKKLQYKLETYILNKTITPNEINMIIGFVRDYEADNISTIDNLMRERVIESNRIKGAIKQFLHHHPVLTKELIGSLSKRIMGSLVTNKKVKKETLIDKIKKWIKK